MAGNSYPHVLIVGGGLGGLALAQALRKQRVSFEIFERDVNEKARPQGWAIGIHSVLTKLKEAFPDDMPPIGPTNHLVPLELPAQMVLYSNENPELRMGVQDDGSGTLIRANRHKLRDWLRTNLSVHYGKKAVRVEESNNRVTVHFADGTCATGDILVGADGAYSVVRDYATRGTARLRDLPYATVTGEVALSRRQMAEQLELGHSAYLVRLGERPKLFVGLNAVSPDGKTGFYYWTVTFADKDAVEAGYWMKKAVSKEKLLSFAKENVEALAPAFRAIIDMTPAEGIKIPAFIYHDVEIEAKDLPASRVTLLGDAAHTMTPFRGEGGVCALRDALDLARSIVHIRDENATGQRLEQIMADYQTTMLDRGVQLVRQSRAALMQPTADAGAPRVIWARPATELPREHITV